MDKLIRKQTESHKNILRFWENTLKVGKEKMTVTYLNGRLTILERYWKTYEETHLEICQCDGAMTTDYYTNDVYQIAEASYTLSYTNVKDAIAKHLHSGGAIEPNQEPSPYTLLQQMQMPKAELPKFSGNSRDWEGFRDLYVSLVHEVAGVASSHKLQLLRGSLTGEAARAIAGFESTEAGYVAAWETLVALYDNKRDILAFHLRSLIQINTISKPSATSIKEIICLLTQATRAFRNLDRPVDHWDDWFIQLTIDKLDSTSRMLWESSLKGKKDFPTYQQLLEFLKTRSRSLAAASNDSLTGSNSRSHTHHTSNRVTSCAISVGSEATYPACTLCRESHLLAHCQKFRNMPIVKRREYLRNKHLCFNCLRTGHSVTSCNLLGRCQHCHGKHHSLVHTDQRTLKDVSKNPATATSSKGSSLTKAEPVAANLVSLSCNSHSSVFLATAKVFLENEQGRRMPVRALLDSGSQATFISEKLVQQLNLKKTRTHIPVKGLQGTSTGVASSLVSVRLRSYDLSSAQLQLTQVLVLPHLTTSTASTKEFHSWDHLNGLSLADPDFYKGAPIDLIIGADVYSLILKGGVIHGSPGTPTAQLTTLGWVIMGPSSSTDSQNIRDESISNFHVTTLKELNCQLQRFWEENEVNLEKIPTPDEAYCEEIFQKTHGRDENGRYCVKLPLRDEKLKTLGSSRNVALKQFYGLETRLERNTDLKQKYSAFLNDYLQQGHMKEASPLDGSETVYYLPHHAVTKAHDNTNKKIRVVFNASAKTTTGVSLNDCLLSGPRLQKDLWLVLTRWRLWKYVFTADIIQMFRQINMQEDDQNLQRILWRFNVSEKLTEFVLTTVTYGTTSAPYLAIKSLNQLAEDEGGKYPRGAAALKENTFVDDIHGGGDSLKEALLMRQQLIDILAAGGFDLSKWAANDQKLSPDWKGKSHLFSDPSNVSTLGILWTPELDSFQLRSVGACTIEGPTKRTVLSDVSKFFDPLGWAAPVLVYGKVFMQTLWKQNLTWDETLPKDLDQQWSTFSQTLTNLNRITVPRYLQFSRHNCNVQLVGFCDASDRAYSAVVYMRCESGNSIHTNLIISKNRVAPMSITSIPRLELCGAVLLSKLIQTVAQGLKLESAPRYMWTDAQVVLMWLAAHPSKWTPYVAHRVAAIHNLVKTESWRYVHTQSNPADLSTRGITPEELEGSTLWWKGPEWLSLPEDQWPSKRRNPLNKQTKVLTCDELQVARRQWLRVAQQYDFSEEIKLLQRGENLPRRSKLLSLRPFVDAEGILRVGGRLQLANVSTEKRHPPILHKTNHLSILLTQQAHHETLHGGPLLMRSVLSDYWIIGGASLAKHTVRQCVKCTRFRATRIQQQMGQLPAERVRPSRPFTAAGVDYAGPFSLLAVRGRGRKTHKAYVALFICLATRAIHIETVFNLTATAFISAFRRFVARRGHCKTLYSDNATNFRGADVELKGMFKEASSFYEDTMTPLTNMGTIWKFIPPAAPHFGGIWEAGIKSVKHHLRRVVGTQSLTIEEMGTLMCQIEACLNSRPICPISNDVSDVTALTPGHFLVGENLVNIPEGRYEEPDNRHPLSRWQHLSAIRDHFWKRWSTEYLHHLQQLQRWQQPRKNVDTGQLVIIRNELQPPAKWPLGRIIATHPGSDKLVRVVTIQTATNIVKRPITKICILPVVHRPNHP